MEINEQGSQNQDQNINSGSSKQPVNQPGRENPDKVDPTREPSNPDHTEPKPKKNDPTRINPDWNDPSKVDPTKPENSSEKQGEKASNASEQKQDKNKNYSGGSYSPKEESGEKNYTGTSAGFMGDQENHEDEPEDNETKK